MAPGKARITGLSPSLSYDDAGAALEWLERVLGFPERARFVDAQGTVQQGEFWVGDTEVFLSNRGQGPGLWIAVWVDDVDVQHALVRAAGVDAPLPVDQSWGVRSFHVTDPGGYHWSFLKRLPSGYQQVKPIEEGGWREIMKRRTPPP